MFMVGVAQTITMVETAAADQILISGQMMQKNNTRRKKSPKTTPDLNLAPKHPCAALTLGYPQTEQRTMGRHVF